MFDELLKLKAKDKLVQRYGRTVTVFSLQQWKSMVGIEVNIIKQGMHLKFREMGCKTGANQ